MSKINFFLLSVCLLFSTSTFANTVTIKMNLINPDGKLKPVGTVVASDTKYGLLFTPKVHDLTPGLHGFHIHINPSCADHGMAAGGHLDPQKTDKHLGPYNDKGHLGDLPALYVDADGKATLPVLAPRLRLADIKGHALMIHNGGDNYSDTPEKLGGGGMRMVCGVIK